MYLVVRSKDLVVEMAWVVPAISPAKGGVNDASTAARLQVFYSSGNGSVLLQVSVILHLGRGLRNRCYGSSSFGRSVVCATLLGVANEIPRDDVGTPAELTVSQTGIEKKSFMPL